MPPESALRLAAVLLTMCGCATTLSPTETNSARAMRTATCADGQSPAPETGCAESQPVHSAALEVSSDEPLGLAELEQIALANNPSLAQAGAAVSIASGRRTQAGLPPNPTIGYQASEAGNGGRAGQHGAFVNQQVVTAGKLDLSRAVADQDVQQAQWRLQGQRRRVLRAVRVGYYEMLAAARSQELADQLHRTAETGLKASRRRFEAGDVARPDVRQAQIQAAQTEILVAQATNRFQQGWRQLAATIGVPDMHRRDVAGSLETALDPLTWQAAWERLRGESPDLQVAHAAVRRAELALQRARVEPIPNLQTQAGVQYDYGTLDTVANVQVGIALPIFNRNQGNIHAAQASVNAARQEVTRVELRLRNLLAEAFARYQNASAQVQTYRDRILPASRESVELVTSGYDQGEFDITRVLIAQRTHFQVELAYLEALAALRKSIVEIEGLVLDQGAGQ